MVFGLELALMGMGTVFIFLVVLIVFTTLMSKFVDYFEHKTTQLAPSNVQNNDHQAKPLNDKIPDKILTQVITAAIQQHRSYRAKR
ncbi:MAG: OadG family protein [gamma proteobacterium symbiont of Bathyaustriella thionipta]|nr:OadG family protein [gamma proteobacterium symbiont of Bathyaustriella thionipta]MCU7951090.1 OadG family protein [gamma proteobacterium symbiont of Bathyaustriella thionipta]MCU7952015.1 OadG family protein [gamma proteobacterium symbiont of Bathyaustriella thionipta]MCU7957601.1 OadG family protein [gamma proteobacterium symbiont of Bathyaustriella thionipta]MCU7968970.1 OadG family protein [gamma proteobacterium symbiont of Bathyaustriella thionipta]